MDRRASGGGTAIPPLGHEGDEANDLGSVPEWVLLRYKALYIVTVMKIKMSSVFVDDQDKALRFYTEVLGFVKETDLPAGEFKWLTVVSPEGPDGIELLLEPNNHPAARTYQEAILGPGYLQPHLLLRMLKKSTREWKRWVSRSV